MFTLQLIDNPNENVDLMLVPSNRSVDIAQTSEALQKLNTLKKLCYPLFHEIRVAVNDLRNDVVSSNEVQIIADNARLLNNLKKVRFRYICMTIRLSPTFNCNIKICKQNVSHFRLEMDIRGNFEFQEIAKFLVVLSKPTWKLLRSVIVKSATSQKHQT